VILDQREQKRRLLLRLKGIESKRAFIGPTTVQLHITDLCNIACRYCWYWAPGSALRPTGKNHLPFDVFERFARDCADLHVDAINLSGQGDPTLHPHFYDILRHLEHSFTVKILSNGTFPIERCRDILRADHIVINLGEADRESYRALVGRDFFIKVIKNIKELARLKNEFNPNFIIEVVFIETLLNKESLLKTESLVRKLGANVIRKKMAEFSDHNRHIMVSNQEEKSEVAGEWPPCYHGWFYSSIKLNGEVNVCCFMQRLTMGNIYKTGFKEIWESDAYSHVRLSALTGDPFKNYHECINCSAAWRNKEIGAQIEIYNQVHKA